MTLYASCADVRTVSGVIIVPELGAWTADLSLESETALTGAAKVKLGGLELAGAIFRSSTYAGRTLARVIGGKSSYPNGWGKELQAKGYKNNGGVRLSLVLRDAAREVGESVRVDTDRTMGGHFARVKAPACRLLNMLAPSWYVDRDGTTVVGARAGGPVLSPFDLVNLDPARGVAVIATEAPEDFAPGKTFQTARAPGTFTVRSCTYTITNSRVRLEVLYT